MRAVTRLRRQSGAPIGNSRHELRQRLESRRTEIEAAALARIYSISDPAGVRNPLYVDGLRTAVSVAIEYGLEAVERGNERPLDTPPELLSQARLAARSQITLDTVLRRYFVGYSLLIDFLVDEAQTIGQFSNAELKALLRTQAAVFDRLLAAVTEEFGREQEDSWRTASSEKRTADHIRNLLAGELPDTPELGYEFDVFHVAIIALGRRASRTVRDLASSLDYRLLLVRPDESTVWAWLGRRQAPDPDHVLARLAESWPKGSSAAIGEPASGLNGWRFTHRQAAAALPVAMRCEPPLARYGDVALIAAILHDDLFATSLRRLYLDPLATGRDGGQALRATLRAYLDGEHKVSSAAAALGVTRQTINNRLHMIERLLDRPLSTCMTELDAALRLEELEPAPQSAHSVKSHGALPVISARRISYIS